MAKINTKSTHSTRIVNRAGGEGYIPTSKEKLLNISSTCLFNEPKYYGEVESDMMAAVDEVASKDPKFILQLAAYLRNEMYLRTISTVMLTKAANITACKQYIREYTPKVLKRADEMNEAIACQLETFGKPVPNSLKKGIVDVFPTFDEYQFAKYNRKGKVTFRDTILLTHPKQPSALIKKILDDKLEVPFTWETELSAKGNKPEVWEGLIASGKLPYMAMLRNLRNMLQVGISDLALDVVIETISNPVRVRRSKQFPFRFFSAYRELQHVAHSRISDMLDALDEAMAISYENIPHMKGTTLIACDTSGSMTSNISARSTIAQQEIGIILGSATHKYTDKAFTGCFGDSWKLYPMSKKSAGIIANVPRIIEQSQEVGWSTNGYLVPQWLNSREEHVDRVLVFTDMQLWDSHGYWTGDRQSHTMREEMQKYWKNINPDCKVYMFNLNGYGEVSFPEGTQNVVYINGWSDKALKFIEVNEQDPHAQVKYIERTY